MLEEFLQEKYVENYDGLEENDNKVEELMSISAYSKYFYIPANEGVGGLRYVIDSDGHALYLIKKSGLPEEIKEQLTGGEAGDKTYADYQSLNDVYGVTKRLKVYYCSSGADSILGLAKDDLDFDNPDRDVFNRGRNKELFGLLGKYDMNNDGELSFLETKSVSNLTINDESGVTDFSDFFNFVNLQELILENLNLKNLDGIENVSRLNYVYFKNCKIDNYSSVGMLEGKLRYLYLYNTTDAEVEKLCSKSVGIADFELPNLEYFAIVGNTTYLSSNSDYTDSAKSTNIVSNIKPLENLNDRTKRAIKYLSLQNNNITDISYLENFINLYLLRLEYNSIESLHGLENMSNLTYLIARNNLLGKGEDSLQKNDETDALSSLIGKKSLYVLSLTNNSNLVWIDYISECSKLYKLFLSGCPNFNLGSVALIAGIYNSITSNTYKEIDTIFLPYLSSGDKLYYSNLKIDNSDDEQKVQYLLNMNDENRNKVKMLDLSNSTLSNESLTNIISRFPNLLSLNVNDCSNLESLEFTSVTKYLEQILFKNTKISGNEVEKFDKNCLNLKSIRCNNKDIDLTKMQKTISRCRMYTSEYTQENYLTLGLGTVELVKQLERCTLLTSLSLFNINNGFVTTLDLSNLTSLEWVEIYNANNCDITLPVSVKNFGQLRSSSVGNLVVAGQCHIEKISFRDWGTETGRAVKFFKSLASTDSSIVDLQVELAVDWSGDYDLLSYLSRVDIEKITLSCQYGCRETLKDTQFNFENWTNKLFNVKQLIINDGICLNDDLNFLSNNSELTELTFIGGKIKNIDGLENLTNLEKINLSKNNILDLSALQNLKKLKTLNLNSNSIEENYSDVKNLQILADLNYKAEKGGSLQEIHLKDNPIIWENTPIEKLSWVSKEGF